MKENRHITDSRDYLRNIALFCCFSILFLMFFVSVSSGVVYIPWQEFIIFFTGGDIASDLEQIIYNVRLPRTIVCGLVGMNLALAGGIMQGVLRNPIASPGILGVTSGAGLGAMAILILLPEWTNYVPLVAFVGAMVSLFAVYILSWQRGRLEPMRLILSGVAMSSLFSGVMTALLVFYSDRVQGAIQWMAGGFQGRSWIHVQMIFPYTVIGLMGVLWSSRPLNVLSLGDEMATNLGMNVQTTRIILMTLAGFLTASAVSVAGLLGFVGLIVPHIARLLVGSDFEWLLPTAAIMGASLVIGADTLSRMAFAPSEVPVGVFMSFLGVPFFLFLLKKGAMGR